MHQYQLFWWGNQSYKNHRDRWFLHGKESRIGERGNETYIYREYSGDSRPILEKQVNGRPKIKIRYEEWNVYSYRESER